MHLYVKNMVCDRCTMVVRQLLDQMDLRYNSIQLGDVELFNIPTSGQLQRLNEQLHLLGFEILDDQKSTLVEKIKKTIIQIVQSPVAEEQTKKLSSLLEEKLQKEYGFLTGLFSSVEGITIEKYAILQRIERVKELLMYDQLSLSQIADNLGYSSVQHLSQQFKKVTGLTPTYFKLLKGNKRIPLDKV